KVRRETEGEGANESAPDWPADHDTDRERVGAELSRPNAGVVMVAPGGNGRGATRKSKIASDGGTATPEREYDESFGAMPDLVIVDGGKGQVSAAHDAMRNLGVGNISLAGLAKRFEE